jgi:hypothetical protein
VIAFITDLAVVTALLALAAWRSHVAAALPRKGTPC